MGVKAVAKLREIFFGNVQIDVFVYRAVVFGYGVYVLGSKDYASPVLERNGGIVDNIDRMARNAKRNFKKIGRMLMYWRGKRR